MSADYRSSFYPMHLALLTVGENFLPLAWWTPISKLPFRFLIAVELENYSFSLLQDYGEAALHFMPWDMRRQVIRAGYLTGARTDKTRRLKLNLMRAARLERTKLVEGAYSIFELTVVGQLDGLSGDHMPFVMEVVHVHTEQRPGAAEPILFLGYRDFATLGERFRFSR